MGRVIKYLLFLVFSIYFFEAEIIANFELRIITYSTVFIIFIYLMNNPAKKLIKSLTMINKGDYNLKLKTDNFNGWLKNLAVIIKKLKDKILNLTFEIQASSSQINSVSEQLTLTIKENDEFMEELHAEATEMKELNDQTQKNIKQTVKEAEKAEELNNQFEDVINNSLTEIMEIINLVNRIKDSSDTTKRYVNQLTDTSKQIEQIIATVNNLSEQTNLLALNAAIESARAGKAGKGFAVVAEEIRELAENSQDSVEEIQKLITGVQDDVKNLNSVSSKNVTLVNQGVQKAEQVEQDLDRVSKTLKEQFSQLNNLKQRVTKVDNIAYKTDKSTESVYQAINVQMENMSSLQELNSRLNQAVDNFSFLVDNTDLNFADIYDNEIKHKAEKLIKTIKEKLLAKERFKSLDNKIHQSLLDKVLKSEPMVEAIWTNRANGEFIYSNPPAGLANGNVREWFKESIRGNEYISDVYISSITHQPCVTISLPIKKEGDIIGVIGADIKIEIT